MQTRSNKRQKELLRKERQKEKQEKRVTRKKERESVVRADGAEDPDIAGIVPGPQPLPEEFS